MNEVITAVEVTKGAVAVNEAAPSAKVLATSLATIDQNVATAATYSGNSPEAARALFIQRGSDIAGAMANTAKLKAAVETAETRWKKGEVDRALPVMVGGAWNDLVRTVAGFEKVKGGKGLVETLSKAFPDFATVNKLVVRLYEDKFTFLSDAKAAGQTLVTECLWRAAEEYVKVLPVAAMSALPKNRAVLAVDATAKAKLEADNEAAHVASKAQREADAALLASVKAGTYVPANVAGSAPAYTGAPRGEGQELDVQATAYKSLLTLAASVAGLQEAASFRKGVFTLCEKHNVQAGKRPAFLAYVLSVELGWKLPEVK